MSNEAQPPTALLQGSTVADLLISAIARYPERQAFVSDEAIVTYRELGEWISRLAQFFDSIGLKPGATVAQLGVNRFEVFAVIAAVYLRGMRAVTLHAMGSEDDHAYVLDDSGADLVIADAYHSARAGVLRERCTGVRHWVSLGELAGFDELEHAISTFASQPLVATGQAEDIIRLAYTGGTTETPFDSASNWTIAPLYGMAAQRHMHEHGTTSAQLALTRRRWCGCRIRSRRGWRRPFRSRRAWAGRWNSDGRHFICWRTT
jgi:long-subunit acyl-CoA synthetase (AMP-forming)